uniref:Uncharacterized protein n=1 Tax=Arundo donax TaxID=35708 RepID=A0A0A9E9E1_ARUDO
MHAMKRQTRTPHVCLPETESWSFPPM